MAAPESSRLLDHPIPDFALPDTTGAPVRLRARVGQGPLVLFFIVHAATPG